jgi:CRISPR-associated endonuclease Csn1
MTNQCTYLPAEDVLPLCSLLFEEYQLLDELNRIRVNGKLLTPCGKKNASKNCLQSTST